MLILLEETGELAKAIRKAATNMSVDVDKMQSNDTVESEVADEFIVLMAVYNKFQINLLEALRDSVLFNYTACVLDAVCKFFNSPNTKSQPHIFLICCKVN